MVRPAWRLSSSWRWTALTASPVLPGRSGTMSLSQVLSRTTPSAVSPLAVWKVLTAAWVVAPKIPSTAISSPWARRRAWIALTSEPRLPRLWLGNAWVEAAAAPGALAMRTSAAKANREEAAEGSRHGRSLPNPSTRGFPDLVGALGPTAGQPASSRFGGFAPARWQVTDATSIARVTASRTADVSARSARPRPHSIQRARNPPPNASPAPTVSTTRTCGTATSNGLRGGDDDDRPAAVGQQHDRRSAAGDRARGVDRL